MANELSVPAGFGPLPTVFQGQGGANEDMSAGIHGGFGLIKYKGKVWSLSHRGVDRQLLRADGDGPCNSIEVVVLKASPHVAKIYYEQGYVEGSTAAPDCFSSNGVTPEISSTKKQANACALCPKNAWGSRVTPGGKQGKACSDSKRLAVVPLADLRNEMFGGPMLLRVPAASLQELATFAHGMNQLGYPYYAIGIRIAFDAAEAYPKFKFSAIRPLSNEEAAIVVELQKSPQIGRILAEGAEHAVPVAGQPQAALPSPFEQPPVASQPAAPAPVAGGMVLGNPVSVAPVAPAVVAAPAPAPVVAEQPAPATTVAPSGFGPLSPDPAPSATVTPSAQTAPVGSAVATPSTPGPTGDGGGFDAALDAQLQNLLPD